MSFKVTYATLAAPSEEMHDAFETAAARVRSDLSLGTSEPARHPCWIGDQRIERAETFDNVSPIHRSWVVGRHTEASADDARAAVAVARAGFESWSHTPWQERVKILRAAAELISERRNELAALMSFEVGKNRFESLADAEESADLIRYYSQQIEDADGYSRPMGQLTPNEKTRDVLRPYGVWAVISPFNFPLALAAGMCAGALLGGNTVVYKPSPDAPTTGLKLLEILREAGLPPDAMSFLTDSGAAVGKALVASPDVSGLVFTGSKNVGFTIYENFNRPHPRPCLLELGGKNPTIVTKHADLDKAAEGVMRAGFGFQGQKCSACSRVYVEREVARELKERLVQKTGELVIGDPLERQTFMGPVIHDRAYRAFDSYVREARDAGGEILHGGTRLVEGELENGFYVAPTIVDGLPPDHRLFRDELFVPFVTIAEVDSLDDALEQANAVEYGLTAGIFSEDRAEVETFFDRIEAGVCHANRRSGATTGAWPGVNPFCGWKASGSAGKGVCGPYYVQQFMREQSQTILE